MNLKVSKVSERFALLLLTAALILGITGCGESTPTMGNGENPMAAKSNAISVQVTYAESETLQRETEFAGKLEAAQNVKVYPEVNGTVAKTYFNAGDTVKKGDLLFELDSTDAQIALKQAELAYQKTMAELSSQESGSTNALTELQYKNAITEAENNYETARDNLETATGDDFEIADFKRLRKKLEDAEDVYDANQSTENWTAYVAALDKYQDMLEDYANYSDYKTLITRFETAYDDYLAAVNKYDIYKSITTGEDAQTRDIERSQAELTYENAQKDFDDHKIYAPVSGVISSKSVNNFDVVSSQTSSYIISEEGLSTVSFNLSEDGASAMTVGASVVVTYNGSKYDAEVIEISPEADSSTGLYAAKAQFLEDIGTTRSGAVVKVLAITAQDKDALTVSLNNIYYDGNQPYLYIYDNGTAKRVDITIGMTTSDKVSVASGITAKDAIITTWHPKLKDGAEVSNEKLDGSIEETTETETEPQDASQPNETSEKKEG